MVQEMIPAGYLAKKSVARPEGPFFSEIPLVIDVYSVGSCVNENFADYIGFWKHNGHWLFDSPEVIRGVCKERAIELHGSSLFFYEVYGLQFDGTAWIPFKAESSLPTEVSAPPKKNLEGFDVVTFYAGSAPECSPLSCNGLAGEIRTNAHCLFDTFDEAKIALESGAFSQGEPGPYRIFAVYSVDWPWGL